jgi:regulator of sigma E protease
VRTGDTILGWNGERFPYFDALTYDPLTFPTQHAGQTITIDVQRADGSIVHLTAHLRTQAEMTAGKLPALGIRAGARLVGPNVARSPLDALAVGTRRTVEAATLILGALGDLATNLTHPTVSGPIGIVQTVGEVRTEAPPIFLVYLIGLLSANLGIINALPIPPMDGGRVAVAVIKGLSRGRLSVRVEQLTYMVGFALLIAFIVWVSYFDLQRGPGG